MMQNPSLDELLPVERYVPPPRSITNHLARLVFAAFIVTFVLSRVLVILIMARMMPDLFLHVGGTHVHHLNYGIFLLSGAGAWMLFRRPVGKPLDVVAIAYAIGLALTFDEFGMWVHLGGSYWQRASYDAVITVGAVLGLIAFAPSLRHMQPRHWLVFLVLTALLIGFAVLLGESVHRYGNRHGWQGFAAMEANGPQ